MAGIFGGLFGGKAARAAGQTLPSYPPGLSDAEIDAVFERARAEADLKTEANIGLWHQDGARWDADLEAGTITFTNTRGWTIVAPVQVIGTRNTADGSFLWGWDHPSVPEPLAADARRVFDFGQAQGLEALTTRKIAAEEDDAWAFTALALHLSGANGLYRGPSGGTHVYMTFGEVQISQS